MAANFERVSLAQLQPWSVIPEHEQDDPLTHSNINFQPRFAVETDINSKVYLWDGNIFALEVEAVVNSTNESLSDKSGLCEVLFRLAGPQLQSELALLEGCRTGESKITKAYGLPCTSHVIHTVGPRYNLKYKTAAENALHNCYRSVLQVLIENKLRTVAYCVINSPKRGYPRAEAAHVALRTVRRFLEKWGADVGAVVFAMNNLEDYESYREAMRLYFPRNNRDLIESVDKFPEDIDETNEFGAKVIKEREIRINAFPIGELAPPEEPVIPTERALISSRPKAEINNAGLRAFMTPVADTPDDRVIQQSQQKTAAQLEAERIDRLYIKLLHQAKQEDLSEIAKRNCVFQSGVDTLGRPVIVFVGARFPEKKNKVLVEKFLKYIVRTLDPLIGQEFILVHFHANISQPQEPEFAWLKMVYKICDRKYIKWVKNFYIVHPSLWVKFTLGLLSPFMKATFTGKTVQVKSLSELFARVEQEAFSLKIPGFVYKYDRKENGSSYMGAEDTPANEGL